MTAPAFTKSTGGLFQLKKSLVQRYRGRSAPSAVGVAWDVAGEVTWKVTGEVHKLLSVMTGEMKQTEIQAALGLKHEDHFRDDYLSPALASEVIEMTVPDKPRSSKQRYRLTTRGRALQGKEQS